MAKQVSAVSLDEIASARQTMPKKETPAVVPSQKSTKSNDIVYTRKIKDKEIVDFFTPYGYIEHDRDESVPNETISVYCTDFVLYFDGFTTMFAPTNYGTAMGVSSPKEFDLDDFLTYCAELNVTPESVFDAALQEKFFNKMPYYVERRQKFTNNNLNRKMKAPAMQQLFKPVITLETYKASYHPTNKTYGSTDVEKIADTLARFNKN